jgi:hypothetical protein
MRKGKKSEEKAKERERNEKNELSAIYKPMKCDLPFWGWVLKSTHFIHCPTVTPFKYDYQHDISNHQE